MTTLAGFTAEAVTGADGYFAPLGPISEDADYILETHSSDTPSAPGIEDAWFDFRTPPVDFAADLNDVPIVLIPRYGFDPAADGSSDWATTELLQVLTRTNETHIGDVFNTTYRHWESYPVPVSIPPGLSSGGDVDLQAEVRDGMNYWNTVLGRLVFVETPIPPRLGSPVSTTPKNWEASSRARWSSFPRAQLARLGTRHSARGPPDPPPRAPENPGLRPGNDSARAGPRPRVLRTHL